MYKQRNHEQDSNSENPNVVRIHTVTDSVSDAEVALSNMFELPDEPILTTVEELGQSDEDQLGRAA